MVAFYREHVRTYYINLAERASEQLQGSCRSIPSLGDEYEIAEDDKDFCNRLDELVYCCEQCNWWFEQGDMAEDTDQWICIDCSENDE